MKDRISTTLRQENPGMLAVYCTLSRKQCPRPVVGNIFVTVDWATKRQDTPQRRRTNDTPSRIDSPARNNSSDLHFKQPANLRTIYFHVCSSKKWPCETPCFGFLNLNY